MATTIQYVNLKPAENGVMLSWTERIESDKKGDEYCNSRYEDRNKVFEGEGDDAMDDAFEKALPDFKKLWKASYGK